MRIVRPAVLFFGRGSEFEMWFRRVVAKFNEERMVVEGMNRESSVGRNTILWGPVHADGISHRRH